MISKFKKTLKNPHKKELLKGSAESMIIKIAGMFVGYAFVMILSRNYGAEAVGIYQIALQFMGIMATIALFGFNTSIIRFTAELVSKNHISELKRILKKFSLIAFSISVLLSITIYSLAENLAEYFLKDKSLALIFQMLSFVLPFFTLNQLYVELIRGLKKIKTSEFLRLFSIRFFNLIGFLVVLWFVKFNNYLPIITFEVALVLSSVLAFYFVYKYIKQKELLDVEEKIKIDRKELSISFTMYQSILLMMLSNQILIFVLAYYTNPAQVGIYNIAFQISNLTIFVAGSIMTIMMPKFSEIYHNERDNFKNIVRFSSKLFFWTAGVLSIITIMFSHWLMSIFGEEFIAGSLILTILSIGNLLNAITGVGGALLDMVGKQGLRRNILLFNTMVTLILGTYFINQFGAIGLAYAVLVRMTISSILSVYFIKKLFDINLVYIPLITKEN